jgi:hypothetical protein
MVAQSNGGTSMTVTLQTGEAYILRTCAADMTSHGGFKWPEIGMVDAPDWEPTSKCGNGLHGFLWGEGDGSLASWGDDARWIVARVTEWIDLGGKVKFPRAEVIFVGDRKSATDEIMRLGARGAVIGASVVAGDYGTATAGDYGTATAGDDGTATAGNDGIIQVKRWDGLRHRIVTGYVGEGGIKPNVAYRLNNDGAFVKA